MTFDVEFNHFRQNIQTFKISPEKSDIPSMLFYYFKIFLHIKFLFVNRFSKCLPHVLQQTLY